jgi:signal transduction histidine kinase
MAKCFMCGAAVAKGILCEKCDKPRRPKPTAQPVAAAPRPEVKPEPRKAKAEPSPLPPSASGPAAAGKGAGAASAAPAATSRTPQPQAPIATATAPALLPEEFPKAPIVHFAFESASPAITSVANVLIASGAAAIVVAPDRGVKFVSDEAKKLFSVPQSDLATIPQVEALAGVRVGDLAVPASQPLRIRNRNIVFSLVPLSGGAGGAVIIFRESDPAHAAHASFAAFVRETVFHPLRSLRDSMMSTARKRISDPFLGDAARTLDQILSSLEMAPEVEEPLPATRDKKVTEVVRDVVERVRSFAELKGIDVQIDVPDIEERFRSHEQLAEALGILMDNSLHYVPAGGQVVAGVRWMEHKGKPLLLFFVMDNGPLVPEALRSAIFEPDFTWNPAAAQRTGRGLFRVREFAIANAGSVWVESKTGKACTFFLRVRPDGAR